MTEALAPVTAAACPSGEIVSEGDQQLEAAEARTKFSVDGSGVKVGILSDSFDQRRNGGRDQRRRQDVESGDLPGTGDPGGDTTRVDAGRRPRPDAGEDSDEGRAMAQIVHDLAPGAEIAFASAFNGEIAFANNIGDLAAAGAEVIVDDVFYPEEPFFQDGPVAVAVREAVDSRRHLLLGRRQQQPDRRRRPRHRLLGNPGIQGRRQLPPGGSRRLWRSRRTASTSIPAPRRTAPSGSKSHAGRP